MELSFRYDFRVLRGPIGLQMYPTPLSILAEFDLSCAFDAKRERNSYCLNSTSVAPCPPWFCGGSAGVWEGGGVGGGWRGGGWRTARPVAGAVRVGGGPGGEGRGGGRVRCG